MAGRPPEYDRQLPFIIWGIYTEAKLNKGFPHQNRTYYVKRQDGSIELVYNSPNGTCSVNVNSLAYLEYLSVEKWLCERDEIIQEVIFKQFVKKAYWFEDKDLGLYERRTRRIADWEEALIARLARHYH